MNFMKAIKKYINLLNGFTETEEKSEEVKQKVESIIAGLNGECGWFLCMKRDPEECRKTGEKDPP